MILVIGLSAVWQRTLFFDGFATGEVNRARRVVETASGKGVNVARVLHLLGGQARVLTLAGGDRGRYFRAGLKRDGVAARVLTAAGQTRVCQTLIGGGVVTELVEESPALSKTEVAAVWSAYRQELARADMLVISGTLPAGCGDDFAGRLAREARKRGVDVVVDTQRAQLLGAVKERPRLVKINRAELLAATGEKGVAGGVATLRRLGAGDVVISDGPRAAVAYEGTKVWKVTPPRVEAVNPIGSGDAMLAGLVLKLAAGAGLAEALRYGVACGAANALTETSGVVDVREVEKQYRKF